MPNKPERIALYLVLAWCLFALFAHLDDPQLEFFDEARRANNALEMARGEAPSLLTPTYYGRPDHWGTKPPLLVWCQAAWMKLLGPGELAVRLPSALATVALLWLLTWWGKRDFGSPLAGALGGLTVLCSWQYMGNHGARTGDYDALLVLFLTAQVVGFYRYVATDRLRYLFAAGAAVFLAGMTKGVAGGFLLPGIGLWLLLDRAGRKKILRPAPYLIVGTAIGLVVGYYFLRETVDPGFLEMLRQNELGGRFAATNEGHRGPWYYYLLKLVQDQGFVFPLLLLVPGTVYLLRQPAYRRPAQLLVVCAGTFLVIISVAATKLYWYKSPVLPLLGMLIGAGTYHLARALLARYPGVRGRTYLSLLLLVCFAVPMGQISYRVTNAREFRETPSRKVPFRDFMRRGDVRPPYSVIIDDYNPNARFYVERLRTLGEDVTLKRYKRLRPFLSLDIQPKDVFRVGERVVVCNTDTWEYLFDNFRSKTLVDGGRCKLILLQKERPDEDR